MIRFESRGRSPEIFWFFSVEVTFVQLFYEPRTRHFTLYPAIVGPYSVDDFVKALPGEEMAFALAAAIEE